MIDANSVIQFWFQELSAKDWFSGSDEVDQKIRDRFSEAHEQASKNEFYTWRTTSTGRLAEILILDQFSRNIHRGTPRAFAQDPQALALAQEAVQLKVIADLSVAERNFIYMPYMHSESKLIHAEAVSLFSEKGMENSYDFELQHKKIIDRFGRYPHRNKILDRESTAEEIEFLKHPGSAF